MCVFNYKIIMIPPLKRQTPPLKRQSPTNQPKPTLYIFTENTIIYQIIGNNSVDNNPLKIYSYKCCNNM